jgi:hypothetical protein
MLRLTLRSLVPYPSHVNQYGSLKPKFVYVWKGENERKKIPVRGDYREAARLLVDDSTNSRYAASLGHFIRFSAHACRRGMPRCLNRGVKIRTCRDDELSFSKVV